MRKMLLHYSIVVGFIIIILISEATASSSDKALLLLLQNKRQLHGSILSGTNVINQHIRSSQQQHTPLVLSLATKATSARSNRTLLKIRGGGGGGSSLMAQILVGKDTAMQVAVASATAVSLIHGCIDMMAPGAVCRYYNVPPMAGMEEILIRRIGALLLATGLVAFAVFFPSFSISISPPIIKNLPRVVLQLQTLDQAVALATLVFWLESIYILVKRLPLKVEFDATATWTKLLVNSALLVFYLNAFRCNGATATVLVTKWIIRIVLAHGILGIVAPSAVLALGGFPPPRKNQDLVVVLGVTRAAGYWSLAFAIFAMSVENAAVHANNDLTLHHLRGFAYSRAVILFRSVYMNFASREVYTSLRLKQVVWLVFDFLVATVLSQSFFWRPTPASLATVAQDTLATITQDMHQHGTV